MSLELAAGALVLRVGVVAAVGAAVETVSLELLLLLLMEDAIARLLARELLLLWRIIWRGNPNEPFEMVSMKVFIPD